jgi:hypothetical protein
MNSPALRTGILAISGVLGWLQLLDIYYSGGRRQVGDRNREGFELLLKSKPKAG